MAGTWKGISGWIVAGILGVSGLAQASKRVSTLEPPLWICVYDSAGVPTATLAVAVKEAQHIFRQAGVETIWVRCSGSPWDFGQAAICGGGPEAPFLTLRILPRFVAVRPELSKAAAGFAYTPSDFKEAAYAGVFYDRIGLMAREVALPGEDDEILEEILAHVMAHELGHLLLGTNSHSSSGIMRARWTRETVRPAASVGLYFTVDQARLIRAAVLARVKVGQGPIGGVANLQARISLTLLPENLSSFPSPIIALGSPK